MKDYQETYVTFTVGEGEAAEVKILPESKFEKLDPKPEPTKIQSFGFHEVETIEEAASLFGADVVNIVNRGGVLKQQTAVRRLMLDEEFDSVEGSYDLATICAQPTERSKMTPVERAAKALGGLTQEQLMDLLSKFAPQTASA